mmetsp:Transcript_26304/g.55438  ORF Transcript_26304/g.55438 Transcript_26304/m.55438 type:complete len:203 (-) Transcript_26304:1535-2143(-)
MTNNTMPTGRPLLRYPPRARPRTRKGITIIIIITAITIAVIIRHYHRTKHSRENTPSSMTSNSQLPIRRRRECPSLPRRHSPPIPNPNWLHVLRPNPTARNPFATAITISSTTTDNPYPLNRRKSNLPNHPAEKTTMATTRTSDRPPPHLSLPLCIPRLLLLRPLPPPFFPPSPSIPTTPTFTTVTETETVPPATVPPLNTF